MANEISSILAQNVEAIAEALLGEPTSKDKSEHRWRNRGSLSVRVNGTRRGLWFDHESGEGGGLIDLIVRERCVDRSSAYEIAKREFIGVETSLEKYPPRSAPIYDVGVPTKAIALKLWSDSFRSISGTPALTYLKSRGLEIDGDAFRHVLRWHGPSRALLGLMTDAQTGEPSGVHRTFLDDSARKIERKMLGKQGVIRISPDEDVADALGICEGIEDALAIQISGWRPVWAAASAGAIARFPILNGVEYLTIFADGDEVGREAAKSCVLRWRQAQRAVTAVVAGGI